MALINKLTNIADAIRTKTGSTATMTLDEMATAIGSIEGGGTEPILESITITENGTYTPDDSVDGYNEVIVNVEGGGVANVPDILITGTADYAMSDDRFTDLYNKYTDKFTFESITRMQYMFQNSGRITKPVIFSGENNMNINTAYVYGGAFNNTWHIPAVYNLPVSTGNLTMNRLNIFGACYMLSHLTFNMNNGNPIVANWKAQALDLNSYIGYGASSSQLISQKFEPEKEVKDDATYQALKNTDDWWTVNRIYSRYNHDSAVETINSLPDVSIGSNNTIKFTGNAGSATDGGAINTLTDVEIAVATEKGWTVTFA